MGKEVKKNPIIICRCENVTLDDVERAIDEGYTDLESLKRKLRIGMGPCQGRTCLPLVIRILARKLRKSPDELLIPTSRPPINPIPMKLFIHGGDDEDEE
ncbi:MAG: (2Fe-2S)-binding protein [Thermoprotei archaeon]|nr:MAG: (2Fe-2S)-binding protein [Thermoprotei archaeon]